MELLEKRVLVTKADPPPTPKFFSYTSTPMSQSTKVFWSRVTRDPASFTPTPRAQPTIRLFFMMTVEP